MGWLVCEAMIYCVLAKARILIDADRNWARSVSNAIQYLNVLMALFEILHGYAVVNVEAERESPSCDVLDVA